VEVNCDVVKEGVNGFAITEEEWIGNLELLRQSPPISAWSCRAPTAEKSFSLRATVPNISEIS